MEREEVVRVAREKMGAVRLGSTGEFGMLARLLEPAERIEAMVLTQPAGRLLSRGVLLVATDRRLLAVAKGMFTRRERLEDIARGRVRGMRVDSGTRFTIDVDGQEREYAFGQPPAQIAELAAWATGRESRVGELQELAKRKFGRVLGFGTEAEIVTLATVLEGDESILDLGFTTDKPYALLALTPTRLIVVPQHVFRAPDPPESLPLTSIRQVDEDDEALVVDGRRFPRLMPEGAAGTFTGRIRARL